MLATLFLGLVFLISNTTSVPDAVQAQRIRSIEDSLLSPCCYGGSVSTHMSEIAFQMRREITEKVLQGESDKEIRQYYVKLYGEQVLIEPEGPKRVMLYALPVTFGVAGLLLVVIFLRKALHRKLEESMVSDSRVEPSAAALKKIRADVGEV